jgi:hypothetical protein
VYQLSKATNRIYYVAEAKRYTKIRGMCVNQLKPWQA